MFLPTARECQDLVSNSGTSLAFNVLALNQIGTALTSGNRSCVLTVIGKTAQDVQEMRKDLILKGFTLAQSSTTITIGWANTTPTQINQ